MIVGRTDIERRVAINSIGPFWDGNEVWLIVAGASMFAAFPNWYASMFSALYLALMLIIIALIIRGVCFEYRGKMNNPRWRGTWDWILTVGSLLLPFLMGIGLGDLLHGLPINQEGDFTGSFCDLLTPYGLWCGLTLLVLTLAHGAIYLSLKTEGRCRGAPSTWPAHSRGEPRWLSSGLPSGPTSSRNGASPQPARDRGCPVGGRCCLVGPRRLPWLGVRGHHRGDRRDGLVFVALYPNVMVSSTNSAYNLTVSNASSSATRSQS